MCVCVCAVCVRECVYVFCVSRCLFVRIAEAQNDPCSLGKQAISHERSCSLPVPCNKVKIEIQPLFRKMAANQKPLNQIGMFWYQFTPRKLLYLMISLNLVKFVPHWLSVFLGPPCITPYHNKKGNCIDCMYAKTMHM